MDRLVASERVYRRPGLGSCWLKMPQLIEVRTNSYLVLAAAEEANGKYYPSRRVGPHREGWRDCQVAAKRADTKVYTKLTQTGASKRAVSDNEIACQGFGVYDPEETFVSATSWKERPVRPPPVPWHT
jgi:hypothetical protein